MKPTLAKILGKLPLVAAGVMLAAFVLPMDSPWHTPLFIAGIVIFFAVLTYDVIKNRCPYCGAPTLRFIQKQPEGEPIYCTRCKRHIR